MSYLTTHDHLFAELARIKQLIAAHDMDTQPAGSEPDAVDDVLDPTALELALPAEKRKPIRKQAETIRQQSHNNDQRLRLRVLASVCGLSRRHLDVLLLALTPDIFPTYERTFQEIHGNRRFTRPTLEYLETLFGRTPAERLAARRLVDRRSPLRACGLVELHRPDDTASDQTQLIVPSERVLEYLSGDQSIAAGLADELTAHAVHKDGVDDRTAELAVGDLAVSDELGERLKKLAARDDPIRCYWYGPASEKQRAVEAVFEGRYLEVDLQAVLRADAGEWLAREAALLGRSVHLHSATEATDDPETNRSLEAVFEVFEDLQTDLIITGRESWLPTETLSVALEAPLEFPYPSVGLRREFWDDHTAALPDDLAVDVLAGTFRLTHTQLNAALSTARTLADGELTADDIYAGCRAQSPGELDELADRIEPACSWDEIQLNAETERSLRLVGTHITQQARIYSEWGFGEQFSHGTGVVALFEGPSGTGKTMAAEILAAEVGMDLYRIDLSSVISKYIGETEQKLEAIFEAATNANAILLFDEADAVFGDRTEVSDSTDRYANAEVNYLLQRLERYDGVVLLTTNYASQIDSAFERRVDHTVSFTKPQQATRTAIWEQLIPDQAPVGEIDYEFLAGFEFTGGQIKTIVQTAAILAADDPATHEPRIEMRHCIEAMQLATEKSGRMVDPTAYEPYDDLLYDSRQTTTHPANGAADEHSARDAGPPSPESVVRTFFDRLDRGDPSIRDLYHSNAVVEPVSDKALRRAQQTEGSIAGELECVQDDPSRVWIECIRDTDDSRRLLSVELRKEDGNWRLFDLTESPQKGVSRQ